MKTENRWLSIEGLVLIAKHTVPTRGDQMTVVRSPWSVVSKAILCLALCAMLFALSMAAE